MKVKGKILKGYITLVVVIILVPFLLLQGINLVNNSIDIVNVSKNSILTNKQYIYEQTCWEEILYFVKNNDTLPSTLSLLTPNITCEFDVEAIGETKFKITLETIKDDYFSSTTRYIVDDAGALQFVSSP